MILPDYRLIGPPARFKNGRGVSAASFHQKFRLLADPARKVRTVSLKTTDLTTARRRAVKYVEARIRADLLARDPASQDVGDRNCCGLKEYLDHLTATGNSAKQVDDRQDADRASDQAGEAQRVLAQIESSLSSPRRSRRLSEKHGFGIVTCNRYREGNEGMEQMDATQRPLADQPATKHGQVQGRRRRKPDREQFSPIKSLSDCWRRRLVSKDRRNLSGEQRYWLYLLAAPDWLTSARVE